MKANYIILITILLTCVIFIGGCIQTTDNTNTPQTNNVTLQITSPQTISDPNLRPSNVQYIGNFMATADKNKIEARFSLMDNLKKDISADGTGDIRIENSKGEEVYSDTIDPRKEYFGTYTLMLTGKQFEAYSWEIPISEIKKSTVDNGIIYLKFKTSNAQFEEITTDIWGLPTYSEQELSYLNEEQFTKSAILVGDKLSKSSFEINVTRVGFFTPLITYGEKKEYFRIDMEVKNIGSEKEYFSPSGLAILDNQGNQYEKKYGGTIDTFSQIYPSVKKSGFILFENIPKTTQSIKLVFQLGYGPSHNTFEYFIPLRK